MKFLGSPESSRDGSSRSLMSVGVGFGRVGPPLLSFGIQENETTTGTPLRPGNSGSLRSVASTVT